MKIEDTLFVMFTQWCTVKLVLCTGPVGSHHCAAPGDQIQIFIGAFGRGRWLYINSRIHVFVCVGNQEHPEETHKDMQTPHKKALSTPGSEPRAFLVWGNTADHQGTVPHGKSPKTFFS